MLQIYTLQADSIAAVEVSDTLSPAEKVEAVKQVDLVDYLVRILKIKNSKERRDDRKIRFSLFPSTSAQAIKQYSPHLMWHFSWVIFRHQSFKYLFLPLYRFWGAIWISGTAQHMVKKNSWNFIGEYFMLNYPQNTWGLGGDSQ